MAPDAVAIRAVRRPRLRFVDFVNGSQLLDECDIHWKMDCRFMIPATDCNRTVEASVQDIGQKIISRKIKSPTAGPGF